MATKEQIEQKCKELFQKELNTFEKIAIKADYLYHPRICYLNIFIVLEEIGTVVFVAYYLNPENLDAVERKQLIASPGAANVLRPLLW
ncbi:MAG TPA: hypothetical protein VNM69_01905 [Bacillus sp. (in: firmicutes)]|nr:hypothetical protein [Bacillus sp. (in: firmicutes)]